MTPVAVDRLERALRSLDDDERAALLAAVWDARGFDVSTEAGVVHARRAGGDSTRVAASPAVPGVDAGVDAVLAVGRERRRVPEGVRAIDAGRLRRLLLYAVDRERGTALARDHLGVPLLVPEPEPGRTSGFAGVGPGERTTVLAVLVVAGVIVASLVAGVPVPGAWGSTPASGADGAADDGDGPGATTGSPTAATTATPTATESPYPPGLSAAGVESAARLGQAHALALGGRSYRLVVRSDGVAPLTNPGRPFDPGIDRWGEVSQRASVANATRYDYRVGGTCTPAGEDDAVRVRRVAYADGVAQYGRSRVGGVETRDVRPALARVVDGGGVRPSVSQSRGGVPDVRPVVVPEGRVGVLEARAGRAVERLFATPRSAVRPVRVNSSARYLVTGSGTPPGFPDDVGNYTVAARVREDGLVEAFAVGYARGSGAGLETVGIEAEYRRVGSTTVEPPRWFETAGGAAGFPPRPADAANASPRGARRCGLPISDR